MSCTTFQNDFGEIKKQAEVLSKLLEESMRTGIMNPDFERLQKECMDTEGKLFEEYKKETLAMIKNWYQMDRPDRPLLPFDLSKYIEFEEHGRLVLHWPVYGQNHKDYFPSLIRKINDHLSLNSEVRSVDYLEEVGGELTIDGNTSFKSLNRVGKMISIKQDIDFENAFPYLASVGTSRYSVRATGLDTDISFIVASESMKRKILKRKEENLKFDGEVIVNDELR